VYFPSLSGRTFVYKGMLTTTQLKRWACAREAVESAGAEGLWAGVVIPEAGRGRTFALRQLRSLAEQHGYPVRRTSRPA
jgi:WhiB family redox-sensing transcriptional regulator